MNRSVSRVAFGKPLARLGGNIDIIANARMDIEQARLLTLKTAWMMDNVDAKEARVWISMIKTAVPNISIRIVDEAIQMFGALGVSQDTPLANMYMAQRTLRLADGPDAVHRMVVGRHELRKYIAQQGCERHLQGRLRQIAHWFSKTGSVISIEIKGETPWQ